MAPTGPPVSLTAAETLIAALALTLVLDLAATVLGGVGCGGTAAPPNTAAATRSSPTDTVPVTTVAPPATTVSTSPLEPEEALLAGMTLEEKAAQVLLVVFDGSEPSPELLGWIEKGPVGGVLLLGRNVVDAVQVKALTAALQAEAARSAPKVALFVAVDQEGGPVQRLKDGVQQVAAARVLGQTGTPEEAAAQAHEVARALLGMGVNVNLAPIADVVTDPASFLYPRSYSGDPKVVAAFASAVLRAYQEEGLVSVVKHFPGHGSASGDTHFGSAVAETDRADFDSIHLVPFRAAIAAGVDGVMMAHVVAPAFDPDSPASMSAAVIGSLLRKELGFQGLVVADDLEMAAAGVPRPAVEALRAGCDLLITTGTHPSQQKAYDDIVAAVRSGDLDEARLDAAVRSILRLKLDSGIPIGD